LQGPRERSWNDAVAALVEIVSGCHAAERSLVALVGGGLDLEIEIEPVMLHSDPSSVLVMKSGARPCYERAPIIAPD
jgi:hypothetical protein